MFLPIVKKLSAFTLLCCATTLCFALSSNDTHINKIVAVVNDQVVTQSDLNTLVQAMQAEAQANKMKASPEEIRKQALDQLIDQTLLLEAAKASGVKVTDQQLNDALNNIAQEHHITVAQLPAALREQGLDYDRFKKQITDQLMIQEFEQQAVAGTVTITPKEIDTLAKKLAKTPPATQEKTLYHFQVILVPLSAKPTPAESATAKQQFDTIAHGIEQNQDFTAVSQQALGIPPQDLGWRAPEQLPQAVAQILPKLQVGQVAPPIRAPNGINILRLIDTKTQKENSANASDDKVVETHVQQILLKSDALTPNSTLLRRLLSIREQIVHGGNFTQLAEENSQDPGSVAQGGDIGWVKPGVLVPKFEAAMNQLPINGLSQPVQTQFGWHLIKVLGRRTITDPHAAMQLKAQQILFQQKMVEAIKTLISELHAQAYINTNVSQQEASHFSHE